jgi:nitrous oxide reductase accessory protein NosL
MALCSWRSLFCLVGALISGFVLAEDAPISRTQAAQLAQQQFGGKVISVDEVEPNITPSENEDAPEQVGTRFIVKLMQNGRVKVVNLDEQGKPLAASP